MPDVLRYEASPTLARFHASTKFIRVVRGPAGSGKSVGCVFELLRLALIQRPQADGVRRSRFLVIRNTMPELKRTTIRTIADWLEPLGLVVNKQEMTGVLQCDLSIGGEPRKIEAEFVFASCDDEKRSRQFKSLEMTAVYFNELSEIPRAAFDDASRSAGRYPSKKDGGPVQPSLIADTNACDTDHWLYEMAEVNRPTDFEMFVQPAAFTPQRRPNGQTLWLPNPRAENIQHIEGGHDYYRRMMVGKKDRWIRVFVGNQYGDVSDGRPVHPRFSDLHVRERIAPMRAVGLRLGWDYGRTPACIIGQVTAEGQLRIIREVVTPKDHPGWALKTFALEAVLPVLRSDEFSGIPVIQSTGDPAGASGGQAEEVSCEDVLAELGIPTMSAPTNDPLARIECVDQLIDARTSSGEPMLLVSATGAPTVRQGFEGRYKLQRVRIDGRDAYRDAAVKNHWSHCMDATQYLALGANAEVVIAHGPQVESRPLEGMTRYAP